MLLLVALYMLPTIVAYKRLVPNFGSIAVINVLLGWTLVGWAVALAMAVRTVPRHDHDAPSRTDGPAASPRAVPARASDQTVDSIQQLVNLRERGLLTEEEFVAAKGRLLGDSKEN